ncbi:DivIVA domain-containing protein [Parafrankia irregularis]|uniref:DivIVA domain-containing protein n=1 Tax=Parafrankia irregularis TaxID=795642 RepID=A0A0S4QU42_9ACTN|nr:MULTISPECIES: DivIVA domain-containing protein [Parafrankia]CUU58639.1 DivIVA domain-containing protein [Parafrankia irregularis]
MALPSDGWANPPPACAHGTIDLVVLMVEVLLVATIVFVVAALSVGRFDRMAPAVPDGPHVSLSGRAVAPADVEGLRFGMAVRGYRMAEVDAVLARLADELAWRDEEIARRDDELVRLAELARLGGTGGAEPAGWSVEPAEWTEPAEPAARVTPVLPAGDGVAGPAAGGDAAGGDDAREDDARHSGSNQGDASRPRHVWGEPDQPEASPAEDDVDGQQ